MHVFYLRVDPDTVPDGFDVIATDWEIALDGGFTDVIHRSLSDTVNLYEYVYIDHLYRYLYGRCRFIFDGNRRGEWSVGQGCGEIEMLGNQDVPC